jgi:3-oxoacyl-[acyl-carrier-protein] synthase II
MTRNEPVRIAVTGLGAVTPIGLDVATTWAAFVAGTSGIGLITQFDVETMGFASRTAGEVDGFDAAALIEPRAARRMDRTTQFAVVASREALADAGLLDADGRLNDALADAGRVGVFIGSGIGGIGSLMQAEFDLQTKGQRRVSPLAIPTTLTDSTPGAVAIEHGLKGPNMAQISACASGANAIGEAAEAIRRGVADVMLAGGSEAAVVPVVVAGFRWASWPNASSVPRRRSAPIWRPWPATRGNAS